MPWPWALPHVAAEQPCESHQHVVLRHISIWQRLHGGMLPSLVSHCVQILLQHVRCQSWDAAVLGRQ